MGESNGAAFVFVTGTGADDPPTLVTAGLIRHLRSRGTSAVGVKPVEVGCSYDDKHDLVPAAGLLLAVASEVVPPLTVAPFRFAATLAPPLAANAAAMDLQLDDLADAARSLRSYGDLIIVEGVAGALSPIADDALELDLAEALGARPLIVATEGIGVQGRVIAVLESARRRALRPAGVVLTRPADDTTLDGQENARMIRERGGVRVFGPLPQISGADPEAHITAAQEWIEEAALGDAILDAVRAP